MSTRAGAARLPVPGDARRHGEGQADRPRPRIIHSRAPTLRERLHLDGIRLAWVLVPLIALLLGGVVFVNVQRLNLTTRTARTVDHHNQAQADILRLRAVLAQKDGQVVEQAARRLGMVQAPGSGLTYVRVPRDARIEPGHTPRTR